VREQTVAVVFRHGCAKEPPTFRNGCSFNLILNMKWDGRDKAFY